MTLKKLALVSAFAFALAGCGDKDKFTGTWSYTDKRGEEKQFTLTKIAPDLYSFNNDINETFKEHDGKLYSVLSPEDKKNLEKEDKSTAEMLIKEDEKGFKEAIKNDEWYIAYKDKETLIVFPYKLYISTYIGYDQQEAHRVSPTDTEAKK